jgi:RNA polymerase sigma-70 factor (ECF subfamily)
MSYRITGSAQDAEDIVQETFRRALVHPPADTSRSVRPYLATIAVNLARDALRKRKHTEYLGAWLPEPVFEAEPFENQPEARYQQAESLTIAFLLALETLSEDQRTVLVLRDVFDWSSAEVADILSLSEENVRALLSRARKKLETYDAARYQPDESLKARHQAALQELVLALQQQDAQTLCQLLRADVSLLQDGGGEVKAATRVVTGSDRVIRFFFGLVSKSLPPQAMHFTQSNGLPAALFEFPAQPGLGPHVLMSCELDAQDRISRIHQVIAPSKLGRFIGESLEASK